MLACPGDCDFHGERIFVLKRPTDSARDDSEHSSPLSETINKRVFSAFGQIEEELNLLKLVP
jgi:hypothetical protein